MNFAENKRVRIKSHLSSNGAQLSFFIPFNSFIGIPTDLWHHRLFSRQK